MSKINLILVVCSKNPDKVLADVSQKLLAALEVVRVENFNFPEDKVFIMPREMLDKIDEIDFSKLQPHDELIMNDPVKVYPIHSDLSSLMPDMTPIFKEMDRQQKQQQRETMKNISRYHSQRSKKFGF